MDPNAALENLRTILEELTAVLAQTGAEEDDADEGDEDLARAALDLSDLSELCDTFAGLDAWLARGGFLPTAWARRREPAAAPPSAPVVHCGACKRVLAVAASGAELHVGAHLCAEE